ncbi:PREDICTED: synaptic vesicle membrane protein VAT-1 homolog-like [Calidris pugnax]|nr:PREDICTED: synaptic vesicle membrane protein VAT-1 homolog-like [Calidris pugnax]
MEVLGGIIRLRLPGCGGGERWGGGLLPAAPGAPRAHPLRRGAGQPPPGLGSPSHTARGRLRGAPATASRHKSHLGQSGGADASPQDGGAASLLPLRRVLSALGLVTDVVALPEVCTAQCGLNFIDLMVRQGNIDNPPKTPLVPGFECSGIVEALGDSVKGFEIGDRVMAFVNYNAWAEVVCTPVEFVYKIPDDMSFSEAAAFPMNFVTAYMMLFEVANLREGMSVLVHSAGGGVGQAVAQLCSTVPNVTVFGTASSFKHEAIKDSVTHLFDRNADYVQEVKRISTDGVDIVLDCLCGENTGKGLSLLKPLGTYILYGSSNMVTGETKSFFSFAKSWWQVEKVNPIKLYEENKVIAGFSLLNLLFKQNRGGLIKSVMDKLLNLYTSKKIKPVVDSLWALEEVKEAMQRIHDRGNIGKLILDVEKAPTPLMANDSTETSEAGEEEEDHEGDNENKERMPFIQ